MIPNPVKSMDYENATNAYSTNNNNTTLLLASFNEQEKEKDKEKSRRFYEEVPTNEFVTELTSDSTIKQRDQWANKIEYMLSVIGYVVDLGSMLFGVFGVN